MQEDFDFLILLKNILFILYTAENFLKVIVFFFFFCAILRCSVLFWFQKISVIACLSNQLFLVLVALSLPCPGLLSLPVSRGVFSQFVSYLVQLVSLLYIIQYSIYRPSVSLVLCELLSVMLSVFLWLLAFCLF